MQSILSKYQMNESQDVIKVVGRNINNLRYTDGKTEKEREEEIKSILMRVNEKSEKSC